MSNFNEDRRQGCVDFKCEPYRDAWKDRKKYIYVASLQKGPHVAKKILRLLLILIEQVMTNLLKNFFSVLAQIFTKLWPICEMFQLPSQITLVEKFDVNPRTPSATYMLQ